MICLVKFKHISHKHEKCIKLYKNKIVGNSGILSVVVVVCVLAPAYHSLSRDLKYSPKVRYIIVVDPLWGGFLIFETVFLGRLATLPYVWKIISQKWAAFEFGSPYFHQTFTKCMFNQYTPFLQFEH